MGPDALEDAVGKLREMRKKGKVNLCEVSRSSQMRSRALCRCWTS